MTTGKQAQVIARDIFAARDVDPTYINDDDADIKAYAMELLIDHHVDEELTELVLNELEKLIVKRIKPAGITGNEPYTD